MAVMAVEIPFVREMRFTYGEAEQVSPLVRRVVARNPSLFTLYGTNTYLVGRGRVAVIDPGPLLKEHQAALRRALGGETVAHILVTHRHLDHCEAATALARETGAPVGAGASGTPMPPPQGHDHEEGVDEGFTPDVILGKGDRVAGPDWVLEVLPTPGHTSDHLCYALPGEKVLITGDHVMAWSTSVVIPPDGDVRAYVASLRLLQARDDRAYLPGHGPALTAPRAYVIALAAHRAEREREILSALAAGHHTIPDIVRMVYAAVDPRLHPAAGLSVQAHLRALMAEKRVACAGSPGREAEYRLR
jgi:glyoxylase-like metal-dependent hydrolase (beta-lactamase superfamily II)